MSPTFVTWLPKCAVACQNTCTAPRASPSSPVLLTGWKYVMSDIILKRIFVFFCCHVYSTLQASLRSLFSYLRTLKTWHCPHMLLCTMPQCRLCSSRSISPAHWAHSSKPTACCCRRQMGQTDGRTDIVLFHRPCSARISGKFQELPDMHQL